MISPGLYFNEQDFNQYAQALGSTTVCLLGGASKGPVNVPTLCTSEGSFVQQFGPPLLTDYGAQAAVRYLRKGNRLLYMRVANTAATSNRTLAGLTGGTPAVKATGTINFNNSVNPADGVLITIGNGTISKVFEFDANGAVTGGNIGVLRGATSAATMTNLITAINNSPLGISAVDTTTTVPQATLTNSVAGTVGNVATTTGGGATVDLAVAGMTGGANAVAGISSSVLTIAALTPGSWGNAISVKVITPSVIAGAPAANFDLEVYAPTDQGGPTVLQERWRNLSLDPTSTRYIETAIANGLTDELPPSRFIFADQLSTGTPTAGTFLLGTGGGTVGTDGISGLVPTDYIGTVTGQRATGLRGVANGETSEYNVISIPGVTHATIVNALIAHVELRRDCWAVIDVPFGLTSDQAIQWTDGLQPSGVPNSPSVALSTSFGSVFAPWQQVYDPYNKKNVWLPPSAFVPGLAADTDRLSGAWFAIAGPVRGLLTDVLASEYSPDITMRNAMVGDGFVNPIVVFSDGPEISGNKTLQRTPNLTQSIHVRRMLIAAYKIIATSARYVVWEPNDSATWKKLEQLCNAPLRQIAAARGLANFSVVFNESTNPPETRARKEVHGKLILQPTLAAEAVVIDTALTSNGAVFSDSTLANTIGVA